MPTVLAPRLLIDQAGGRIIIRLHHCALFGILPAIIVRAQGAPDYRPGTEILVDCRPCPTAPSFDAIFLLADALAQQCRGPIAFLADTPHMFGAARMIESFTAANGFDAVRVVDGGKYRAR